MLNKCKIGEVELLFYGTEEELEFPEWTKIETLEKDIKITEKNADLTVLSAKQLMDRITGTNRRTNDIVLSENKINSFNDLKAAYFLMQYHQLSVSKSVRDRLTQKYTDVLDYVDVGESTEVSGEE